MLTAIFSIIKRGVHFAIGLPILASVPYLPDLATRVRRRCAEAAHVTFRIDLLTSSIPDRLAELEKLRAIQGDAGLTDNMVARRDSFENKRDA